MPDSKGTLLTRRRLWLLVGGVISCLLLLQYSRAQPGKTRIYRYPPIAPIKLPSLPSAYIDTLPSLELPPVLLHPHLTDLATRLHAFLSRPILGNDTESIAANYLLCPRDITDPLVNPDQYRGNAAAWAAVDAPHVIDARVGIVQYLADIGIKDLFFTGEKRQGIVMTAGNQDTTQRTITSLGMLRATGCTLPVEVFHYEEEGIDRASRMALERLGAEVKAVKGVSKHEGAWKNWQIKGSALLQSTFSQILYLDSDNTVLSSPDPLFSHPQFLSTGAAFWPDLSKDHPDNAIWRIIGDPCTLDYWTFESGQILLDKQAQGGMVNVALYVVEYMLKNQDEWFKYCGGDKDTFRWAWRVLGLEWTDPGVWMGAVGWVRSDGRFCGHSTLQFGLDEVDPADERGGLPKPMFMHSNLLKHIGHVGRGKGEIFKDVKYWPQSTYASPHLNYANTHVVKHLYSGFCLDMAWHPLASERLSEEERERWGPRVVPVEEWVIDTEEGNEEGGGVRKGAFEGYEDSFWLHGGRVGGW